MTDRDLIAEGRKHLAAASTGIVEVYDANAGDNWPPRPLWSVGNDALEDDDAQDIPVNIIIDTGGREHAELIAWAFNNLVELLDDLEGTRIQLGRLQRAVEVDYPAIAAKQQRDAARIAELEKQVELLEGLHNG